MIRVRRVENDGDLETWAAVKSGAVPTEPVTAEQLRASGEYGRLLVLAELDGELAGCGIAQPSSFDGFTFAAARVLPQKRGRGVGTVLAAALLDHAVTLDRPGLTTFVDAAEPRSVAFAERYGLADVDVQLEQRRLVGDEPVAVPPEGVELSPLAGRREELLRAAWPVAREGYADLPVPGSFGLSLAEWLRDEATRPEGSFVAFEGGEPVGYAGLLVHANGAAAAEHGLTVVRRDRRRRGIARALKQAQLRWAAGSGVLELVTWTQRSNVAMQALNRSLGYVDASRVITYRGPLPSTRPPA